VRVLRTDRMGDIRLTLRKLHVRWWHASHHSMRRMLERCGVAEHVLQMLPAITQTCMCFCLVKNQQSVMP
jgi:hypothetical protein